MKTILLISLLHFTFFVAADNGGDEKTTSQINKLDEEGRKQGKWIFLGKDQPEKGYPMEGKISEGTFVNDRKNGEWTMFYKDGVTPRVIGEFKNNRPNGTFVKFYPNGKIKEEGTFDGQRYIDTIKRYNIEGVLVYKSFYDQNGREAGIVQYFHDNGSPEFVYEAVNGIPTGEATRYYSNGDVKEEITYEKDGKLKSTSGIIEPDNSLEKEKVEEKKAAPIVEKEDLKLNGYNTINNENKELWMEGKFKKGKLWDGRVYIYDENGLLLKVEVYKKGVYHSDGQL